MIQNEGKYKSLGHFSDEHEAALAYDVEARKLGRAQRSISHISQTKFHILQTKAAPFDHGRAAWFKNNQRWNKLNLFIQNVAVKCREPHKVLTAT